MSGRIELARLFVAIGGLIVLALTAALVGPYFVDWSSYRAEFEREAGRILGREVTVEGSATARLLPFPSVTFTDVSVAGERPGEPAMTIDEFSMDAELAPFLRGEVLIFDMQLVRPVVSVEIDEQGGIDWAVRPSSGFDARQVTLESVSVQNGSIRVHHAASGRTHEVTQLNAELSAGTLAGPWHIDGAASVDGMATAISVSTGRLGEDGRLRVRVDARPDRYPLTLQADGDARFDADGKAVYAGEFRLNARQGEAAGQDEGESTAFPASGEADSASDEKQATDPGNRLHGTFSLDSDRLSIDEFRFETGPVDEPYTAQGKAFVTLGTEPRFSITADGAQLRFDVPSALADGRGGGKSIDERFAALSDFVAGIPKPSIPGTVRVNLPAVVTGDTTIRDIRLSAEPAEAGWRIESAGATLPGRTRFEGDGLLRTRGELAFSGHLVLAVKQPSGFAAWLAKDVDEPIRRLPAAGFSADVDLSRRRQAFDGLELILGEARFHGRMERQQPADAQPSLAVELDGDKLDVEGMTAFASLFVSDTGVNRLADHDVDLKLTAGPVDAAGLSADSVDTALRLRAGRLEIDKLTVSGLAGANVSATGTIDDFSGEPTGKLDASVVAVDLAPLVSMLAERFPGNGPITAFNRRARDYPGLLEDAGIDVVASAADNGDGTTGVAMSAQGLAGGTAFSFTASGNDLIANPRTAPFSVNFTGKNDEAAVLYALYGVPGIPLGLAGGAQTEISAKGNLTDGMATTMRFTGDGLTAGYDGTVRLDDAGPILEGKAKIESVDLEPWLAAAAVALPGFGYGLPANLGGEIEFSEGLLVVSGLDGVVAGSTVAGDLNAEIADGLPHITGSLNLDYLDMALPASMVTGESAIAPDGSGKWPDTAFAQSASPPFNAEVSLGVRDMSVANALQARDAQMMLRVETEGLHVQNLSAKLFGGRVKGLADLTNNAGAGLFSAQFSLDGASAADLLPGSGLSGTMTLSASATASGKSVAGMVSALAGSGSAELRDLVITGINPEAFGAIIRRADAIGREIDAADTASFAQPILGEGRLKAGDADVAFTLADGTARTPPVRLEGDGVVVTAETRLDLQTLEAHAEGAIDYDAGEDALDGSEPSVRFVVDGPLDALSARFDTDPLAQFLTQRALEKEQARVEHMQAVLLEKQRLRRESSYYAALADTRARAEEERRRFQREEERARMRARERAEEEAERRRREAEEQTQPKSPDASEATGAEGAGGNADARKEEQGKGIRREPLAPPEDSPAGAENGEGRPDDDAVSRFFEPENLTVDGLLDLIKPTK